jgi:hypothetical protein
MTVLTLLVLAGGVVLLILVIAGRALNAALGLEG